ncbi:unnamed protein product [Closterium sp. NIES-53]
MHSRLLVSGLPRSLPSLPRSPAPPCLPCVEGRQRAAPHSSEFPPTTAPLQTLHMDVWGPALVGGTDQECYFVLVVDDYTRYTTVFLLRRKADVSGVLIPWIRATHRRLREWFSRDFRVLRLHSDRSGEFSSDLLAEFCRDEGISSRSQTSLTLRWTGKVGDASVFRVWGALSLVRDAKASKLSSRTLRCAVLGFPTDAPPWQFYQPRSRRVFSSQDVTFDETVCYYRIHPHAPHPVPLVARFLVPVPPLPVDPLPPQGPAPSAKGGDPAAEHTATTRRSPRLETPPGFPPRPSLPPLQPVAVDSGAETAGAKLGSAETEGEGFGGAATGGAATGGAGSGGAATRGAGSWGATTGGADSWGPASPSGGGAVGDPAGGPGAGQPPQTDLLETLLPQAIRAWIVRRGSPGGGGYGLASAGAASPGGTAGAGGARDTSPRGATRAGGAGPTSPGGTADAGGAGGAAGSGGAGAGGTGGAGAAGRGGAGTGVGGAASAEGAGGATGATGTGDARGTTGARGPGAARASGAAGAGGAGGAAGAAGAGGAGVAGAGGAGAAGTALHIPFFYPQTQSSLPPPDSVLRQVLILPSSTGLPLPLLCPPTDQSQPQLLLGFPQPALAPHTEVTECLPERRGLETRASTPICACRVARPHPPAVPGTHGIALRPSSVPQRVVLPEPPASSLPHNPDPESDLARAASPTLVDFAARSRLDYVERLVTESESVCPPSVGNELAFDSDALEDRQIELECLAAALPRFTSMLLCPEGDPDALDIPTLRSYAEAIAAIGGRHLPNLLPHPPHPEDDYFSVLLHVAAQRDYELHSLDISTAFLQGSLHEEIWLCRPPGFAGSFPASTQWSLRRPVYVYVDDLVFATTNTDALAQGKAELQERHTCTDLGELHSYLGLQITRLRARRTITLTQSHMVHQVLHRFGFHFSLPHPTPLSTGHSLSAPPSNESIEPSGPYPELVGCLMYLMTCTRPDLAYKY